MVLLKTYVDQIFNALIWRIFLIEAKTYNAGTKYGLKEWKIQRYEVIFELERICF